MKTSKIILFFILTISLVFSCSQPEDISPSDTTISDNEISNWVDLIQQLDLASNSILVQHGGSVQEALDKAKPGDNIYIEPGIYKEALTIKEPGIKLIGIPNEDGPVVLENPGIMERGITVLSENVKVYNVEFSNYDEAGTVVLPLNSENHNLRRRSLLLKMEREELGGRIAHYTFDVKMGEGEFDVVTIHRVVMEPRPYRPVRTRGNIFMIHGSIQDFDDVFLTAGAEAINSETSAPFYMAANGIDVWGIDLAWNKIPLGTSDFSFLEGWGIDKDVDHTLAAMAIARLIRGITRQGFGKMNLLGFSYGVAIAYGAAGRETQIFPLLSNIKGLIPVDFGLKYGLDDENKRLASCTQAANAKKKLEAGEFATPGGIFLMELGDLALNKPNEVSQTFPHLSNAQAINFVASVHSGNFHFCGGTYEGLYYTDPHRFSRLAVNLAPHMPRQTVYEMAVCSCNEEDVSFDDHFDKIKLPIFYITAEGGQGPDGNYLASLTNSSDISFYNVDDPDQEDPALDFGHGDLWLGYDAAELVWEPLRQWLLAH